MLHYSLQKKVGHLQFCSTTPSQRKRLRQSTLDEWNRLQALPDLLDKKRSNPPGDPSLRQHSGDCVNIEQNSTSSIVVNGAGDFPPFRSTSKLRLPELVKSDVLMLDDISVCYLMSRLCKYSKNTRKKLPPKSPNSPQRNFRNISWTAWRNYCNLGVALSRNVYAKICFLPTLRVVIKQQFSWQL